MLYTRMISKEMHTLVTLRKWRHLWRHFSSWTGDLLEASAVYFVSGGVCTWKWQSVEMAAVRVSGTVTNDNQRAYLKIETLHRKTPTEIHSSLMEVCGVETVDRSTISRWVQRFREGRLSIKNDPKSGRPRTSTDDQSVEHVLQILEEDRRMMWRNCTFCWNSVSICLPHFDWTLAQTSNCHPVGSAWPQWGTKV